MFSTPRPDKVHSAAAEGVLLGYGFKDGRKGYKALVPKQGKQKRTIVVTQDVSFGRFDSGISLRKIKWSHLYKDAIHQQLQLQQETPVTQKETQRTTTNLTSPPNSDISNNTNKPEDFVHYEDDAPTAKNQSDTECWSIVVWIELELLEKRIVLLS